MDATTLTPQQERYCQARTRGLTQREAFREAYPNSVAWKDSSVDCNACKLEARPPIAARMAQLAEEAARDAKVTRAEVIGHLAAVERDAYRGWQEAAREGALHKDAASVLLRSSAALLEYLPEDPASAPAQRRVTDFGLLLGRAFVDLHRDWQDHLHDEYWLRGGRGSLKTSTAALEIVEGVANFPGRNALCMRNRTNKLRTSVYAEVKKAARRLGVIDEFDWMKSPLQAVHRPTGNVIYFFGADNVNPEDSPLKGFAPEQGYVAYLWLEEASQFPGYAYVRNVRQTVLRGGDEPTWTVLTYNPPVSANSWVNREAEQPQAGRLVHRSHFSDAPREWLGEAFWAVAGALKKRNPKAYRHEYDGEAVGTGANVFDPEVVEVRPITDEERRAVGAVSHGVDAGSVHPWVHERVAYDPEAGVLYVLDEDSATGGDAHDTATAPLLEHRLEEWGEEGADLWCDSAAPGMIRYYQSQGLAARKAYKQGVNSPRERVRWLNRMRRIVIDPERAPMAARQFRELEYVTTPSGDITETLPKVDDDAVDAVGYACGVWIRQGL